MYQQPNGHIVAFLSLEDFAQEVIAIDNLVRVESITRTLNSKSMPGGLVQWLIIITAQTRDGIAMISIQTGEVWKIAVKDEPYHKNNADQAVHLVKQYLEAQGFIIAPGIWNPKAVIDNIVGGHANLWHFESKQLVPNSS